MERSPDLDLVPPPAAPPSGAGVDGPPPAPAQRLPAAVGSYLSRLLTLAAGVSAVTYGYQVLLHAGDPAQFVFAFPTQYFGFAAAFLTAATLLARRRAWMTAAVSAVCAWRLYGADPRLLIYAAGLIPSLYFLLGRADRPGRAASVRFWLGIFLGMLLLPKAIQGEIEHYAHNSWLDANQNFTAGLFLRYAYYYYERRRGLVPAGRFWEHAGVPVYSSRRSRGCSTCRPREMAERWGFGSARRCRRGFASRRLGDG